MLSLDWFQRTCRNTKETAVRPQRNGRRPQCHRRFMPFRLEQLEERTLLSIGLAADDQGQAVQASTADPVCREETGANLAADFSSSPGEIHGGNWNDLDGDGVWDQPEEPGLEGWTVYLDLDEDGQWDEPDEPSAVTDADGHYQITDVAPGTYTVAEVPQPGWVPGSGELGFVEHHWDGEGGVDGLDSAFRVAVSPDGSHVYATGASDDALVVFSRDGVTGQLSLVQVVWDDQGGVDGLNNPRDLTLSPDGDHVYVTAASDNALAVFSRDAGTGELTFVQAVWDDQGGVDGLQGAGGLTISPDGSHVYVRGGDEEGALAAFSRDPATGELTFVQVLFDDQGGVDGLSGGGSITVSPDGSHVYTTSSNPDRALAVFSRDAATGELSFLQELVNYTYPMFVTVSPDGRHVYATGHRDDALAVFSRDAITGELSFVEHLWNGQGGVDGLDDAGAVTVSPEGSHVYATGGGDDALVLFSRDAATGELTFVQAVKGWDGPVHWMGAPSSVTVSPDGNQVYVTAGSALMVFNRDVATGELALAQSLVDGQGGVDGLAGAISAAVTVDGEHVYVASYGDNALAVFDRDPSTGELTFVQVVKDGEGGVDGLAYAYSVAVSPDGSHVYAVGRNDHALAVFSRNATTGELTFVEVLKQGEGGVDGIGHPLWVTVSPDGGPRLHGRALVA